MFDVGSDGLVTETVLGQLRWNGVEIGCALKVLMSVECWDVMRYVVFWDGP